MSAIGSSGNGFHGPVGDGPMAPPQNLEAEQSVLGAVLLSDTALPALIIDERLSPDDFYRESHGRIYQAMLDLHSHGEPVDALTLVEHLKQAGDLESVGGAAAIELLAGSVPAVGNLRQYARIVRDNAMLRRLLHAAYDIQAQVHGHEALPRDLVDMAERAILEVAHEDSRKDFRSAEQLLDAELDKLQRLSLEGNPLTGTPSGYEDLDAITGGFQPGNLIVLAARPSMGKCLAGGTLIPDPRTGARTRIDELVARVERGEEAFVTSLRNDFRLQSARVAAVRRSGKQPVFRLVTRLGRKLEATANHPLLTLAGWKRLDELTPGARVAVPRRLPVEATGHTMPDHEVVLLAALIADGNLTERTPRSCFGSESGVVETVREAAAAIGLRLHDSHRTATISAGRGGGPNPLTALCQSHGLRGRRSHDKFVPDAIFRLSDAQIARFLSVLFACDGHVYVSDRLRQIGYTTISGRLAHDVQHLLLRLGVVATIRTLKREVYEGTAVRAQEVRITGRAELDALARLVRVVGNEDRLERVLAGSTRLRAQLATPATAAQSDALAESDVWWDEVASIVPLGEQETYDLDVPGLRNFVAGDFVVHNSALMVNFAENAALHSNKAVALFSLEMSEGELAQRFIASQASIKGDDLRKGRVPSSRWGKILAASSRLAQSKLFVDDSSDLSVLDVRAKARRLAQQNADGLGLILIDYLQLMRAGGTVENRVEQIGIISRGLKTLARELEVPVIALSQLNRGVEQRTDKRPVLSDLRESGSIEQDADLVMFVYRDDYYDKESEREGLADLIIAKHRNGGLGTVELTFQKEFPRFMSYTPDDHY